MILVCGEALFDVFVEAGSGTRIPAEMVVGGSPLNVAVGLARLGIDSSYFSGLSTDRFGEILRDTLVREGVDISHVRFKPNPTTISIVAKGEDGQPRYAFYGADAADRSITPEDLPRDLPANVRAITMGSYTLVVPPVADALAAFAEREGSRRVISLDPNLRPTVIGDVERWPAQFDRFARHSTIIKSSDEDIEVAFKGGVSVADAAKRWLDCGAKLVVVTRGGEGALAFTGGEPVSVPGRKVQVVDTVGAGDTFHAALLADLDRRGLLSRPAIAGMDNATLAQVLTYAVTASSITCTRRGADLPTQAEVAAALAA